MPGGDYRGQVNSILSPGVRRQYEHQEFGMDSFHIYSIGHMPGSSNIVVTQRSANFAAFAGYRSPETIDAAD